ncbi:MAG: hypothetical protein D6768_13535 [Chloroflexi bacterium]|nr:MAG: hypothetical protein D6768_13535 [Chloroflexota bacterium]
MTRPKPNLNWVGSTLGGRYTIDEFIDQGGMSAVYRANDPNLKRAVAIKLIHPHLSRDPKFVQRFEQEAASVAKLRHPNIVQVYDFNHDENTYYMVMEYVQGQTLKQVLKKYSAAGQRLPLSQTIRIVISICDAVAFAHEHGMVHRDLKPANVMINQKGQIILMDFGVVKMLGEPDLTAAGATIGTAKYMSPEQARGGQADERSDIYALGVMLYEMVAGKPPFDSDTTVAILMKHVNEAVPDIREAQADIPEDLVEIIQKALAKNPNERYQSAAHIATALRLLDRLGIVPPSTDSQSTLSSKPEAVDIGYAPASPRKTVRALPAKKTKKPAVTAKSKNLKYWGIGLAVAACAVLFAAAGLLTYFFSPLLHIEQITGIAPDLPSADGMVRVSADVYSVGFDTPDKDHAPRQSVELSEFWIDRYEVTNAQYQEFLSVTRQPPPAGWPEGQFPAEEADFPVAGITWDQAGAYCAWAKKRLPTEAEWEIAARGSSGRLFPWGDNQQAVQLPHSGVYAAGSKLTNQSPFGVFDMAGNVWEWVDQPYAPIPENQRILRGGANDFLKDMAYRLIGDPSIPTMFASAGVRCAANQVNGTNQAIVAENVFFEDSFGDPGSGWPILSEGAFYYGYHPPDFYHVEVAQPENLAVVSRAPNFDTVTVESEVLIDHTDTETGSYRYGLVLRRVSEDEFYAFTVVPQNQSWEILKSTSTGFEVLDKGELANLHGVAPAGITPEKADKLQVDANGPDFLFHINQQAVAQIHDPDYPTGEVGFFVQTFDESLVHAHFDQLTIRQVEDTSGGVSGITRVDDQFTNPDSGWPTEDKEGTPYRFGYHPPDFYHVEPRAAQQHIAVTEEQVYQDVGVETEVFVDHTDTETGNFRYGLALRRTADNQFYAFTVSPRSQSWHVLKISAAGAETLAEGEVGSLRGLAPPGITPDGPDTLRVDALGSTFAFQINGEPVAQISDSTYAEGNVGFYVENLDETLAHIHYESLLIGDADPQAIAGAPKVDADPAAEPAK